MKGIRGRKVNNGEITASEIQNAYIKTFKVGWFQRIFGGIFKIADQTYAEADVEKIKEIISQTSIEKEGYEAEEFDCDDFAFALMGAFHADRVTAAMPIFITWVYMPEGGHALLSFYKDGKVTMIEPQNDEMFDVPNNWQLFLVCG